jgi:MoaA/NifB/PqqE/SkfB family radical SAM enzyme
MMHEHIKERMIAVQSGERLGPLVFELSVTKTPDALPTIRLLELVAEACRHGAKEVRLIGDHEFFARRKAVHQLMKAVKGAGARGVVTTDCSRLSNNDILHIKKLGWDELAFPLYSANERVHDYLCGISGGFFRTISAVKGLAKIGGANLTLHTWIARPAYSRFEALIELAAALGVSRMRFSEPPPLPQFRLDRAERLYFSKRLSKLQYLLDMVGIESNLHAFQAKRLHGSQSCPWPSVGLSVAHDGAARPCPHFPRAVDSLRAKPLMKVWHGKPLSGLRLKQCSHACNACEIWQGSLN